MSIFFRPITVKKDAHHNEQEELSSTVLSGLLHE